MGLKIKAGMAIAGMAMSWFCGIPFLSGIASHLDTTGNVMVDIADGIGLISKGIEALENYLDPPKPEENVEATAEGGLKPPPPPNPTIPSTPPDPAGQIPPQQIVWRKGKNGKDIHYDPSKDKVLQKQLIQAERQRIIQEYQTGALPADTVIPKNLYEEKEALHDLDDDDRRQMTKLKKAAVAIEQAQQAKLKKVGNKAAVKHGRNIVTQKPNKDVENNELHQRKISSPDILDPSNPILDVTPQAHVIPEESVNSEIPANISGWKLGTKRMLGSLSSMFGKANSLLLKVVATIFPWNRRARRRLANIGDEDDDEL